MSIHVKTAGGWVPIVPGGGLEGLGGWADVSAVTGNPKRYDYTDGDGNDWSALEWTADGSVTTSGGMIDTLVIGGGGQGGSRNASYTRCHGGGGAGGVARSLVKAPNTALTVHVGAGAARLIPDPGEDSYIGDLVVGVGGGMPMMFAGRDVTTEKGGSGAGGAGSPDRNEAGNYVHSQGHPGGRGFTSDGPANGGGGGGGAGAAGADGTNTAGGAGGDGIDIAYFTGEASRWVAGGGGGCRQSGNAGAGGQGGGGAGATNGSATDGAANTGAGGGGAYDQNQAGNGGSGLVLIRVPKDSITATTGWVTRITHYATVTDGYVTGTHREYEYPDGTVTPVPAGEWVECDGNVTDGWQYHEGQFFPPPYTLYYAQVTDGIVTDLYHETFYADGTVRDHLGQYASPDQPEHLIPCTEDVQVGWTYNGAVFTPPKTKG